MIMEDVDILADTYERLAALIADGKTDEGLMFLRERFTQLPEDVQGKILVALLADAVTSEAGQIDAIASIQKESIAALEALEIMKQSISI